ncbi:MAG: UvrD-helicase domain-containing protein [Paludibacteraceae bacterium]|nr:UvrD-helicase domain-containing protein [Paludibacteraceae bacterium]
MINLEELNQVQREAVEYNEGPQLVIAGAGSGKTRVLTYKIAYLLDVLGVEPNRILALTFTNKAAREMKERIGRLVSVDKTRYLWMGTFHSICARILRQEAQHLGLTRDFSIYDTTDSKSLIKRILKEKGLDEKIYKPALVLNKISTAKNRLCTPQTYGLVKSYIDQDRYDRTYDMPSVYQIYQTRLHEANAVDFDDLLMLMCQLLQNNAEARAYYQSIFKYILVDEYQDTNYAQYLIVKILAEPENLVSVVGDDAQSIYSFRGADIANILSFQKTYPNARVDKLEQNYRSTQCIVNLANSLIQHNQHQLYKSVFSKNAEGDRVSLQPYMSDRDEAQEVITQLMREHAVNKIGYNQIAVLYRTNAQSRAFEGELRKMGIPYRIYGGMSFYQRKEIKDAICYFRLAANPKDNEALQRIINLPARHIGDTTLRKLSECAQEHNVTLLEVAANPDTYNLSVVPMARKSLMEFAQFMAVRREEIETKDAYTFAQDTLRMSGVMTEALMDTTPEGQDRAENLNELLNAIREFVEQRTQMGIDFTPMSDFLGEVALLTDQDEHTDDPTQRVTLMTVHAAKGLEFPVVFIVGLEEDLFPSQYCVRSEDIEEERRLLYVAITRAMTRCYLSFARQRYKNGQLNFCNPSRFLKELDRNCIRQGSFATKKPETPVLPDVPERKRVFVPERPINLKPITATPTQTATSTAWQPNDRVYHKVFGDGTVLQVYNENEVDKIDINFDKVGKKTLMLTYAKLEKR